MCNTIHVLYCAKTKTQLSQLTAFYILVPCLYWDYSSSWIIFRSSFFGSTAAIDTAVEEKEGMGSSHNLQVEVPDVRRTSLTVPDANLRQRRTSYVDQRRGSAVSQRRASRPVTMHMSRKAVEIDASSEGSGTDYSDDEVLMLKKDDGFRPVKGQPGMYYKVSDNPCYLYTQNRNNFREYSWVFEPFLIGQCVSETLRFFEEGFAITSSAFCRPTRDSACNIQDFQRVYLLSNIWLVIAVFPCSVDTDNWHSSSSSEVWVWELLLTRLNVGFLIAWPIKTQVNMGGTYVKEATWS